MFEKVDAADDQTDERVDQVLNHRIDDGREGRTDDDTDGKVKHIATRDEFLEFVQAFRWFPLSAGHSGRLLFCNGAQAPTELSHIGAGFVRRNFASYT